jgi:predicted nucleic acid-binding protein
MIILDTNVLSELIKPQGSTVVRNWASRQPVTSSFTTDYWLYAIVQVDLKNPYCRAKLLPHRPSDFQGGKQ